VPDPAEQITTTGRPLSSEQLAHYDDQGYVVVENVLSSDEIAELRRFFAEELFAGKPKYEGDVSAAVLPEGRGGGARHDIFSRYPELRGVLVNPNALAALRSLLGDDFVFLPEMAVHDSRYGHWHKDTTPMERDGLDFHKQPDFKMVQCAIYFQDNDEYGGGLDVVPKSHTEPDHTPPAPKWTFLDRVRAKLGFSKPGPPPREEPNAISIASKAGDLVLFNVLLNHQATQPRICGTHEVPAERRKFAIFFICGANNEHSRRYVEYISGQYAHLKNGHTYPDDLLQLTAANDVNLI
jgi:ectoine hydroxylase-related dioxygenase (phytanoyl-CoA dioxygenase family)